MNNNSQSWQPNAGDAFLFLKWVLINQANPNRCERVSITQTVENDFAEFPRSPALEKFDPSVIVSLSLLSYSNLLSNLPQIII